MDLNKIYRALYLYTVDGVTDIKEIAEQTGLSIGVTREAVDSKRFFPRVKEDFKEDQERGEYSRTYEVKYKRLQADSLAEAIDRYVNLILRDGKTLDFIKGLMLSDNVKDGQINSVLAEVARVVSEHKAERLQDIVEELLEIEQLPSKFTINKALEVTEVFPSPMVDRSGHVVAVKYTAERVDWRKALPTELAIKLYEIEHPLWIDGHKVSPDLETWGPTDYRIIAGAGKGKHGFYKEVAEYLGMAYSELVPYIQKAKSYVTYAEKEKAQGEPTDFNHIEQMVAQLKAEYVARGGVLTRRRNSRAVTAE